MPFTRNVTVIAKATGAATRTVLRQGITAAITAIAARRPGRDFRVDIAITVLKPGLFIPWRGPPGRADTLT